MRPAIGAAGFNTHPIGIRIKFVDGPAFTHVGARRPGVFEQKVVERRALDLDGFRLTIEFALAERETGAERAVAQLEARAEFCGKPAACSAGNTPISRKMVMLQGRSDSPM